MSTAQTTEAVTVLAIGTFIKAVGFDRAFPLDGVRTYCADNDNGDAAWARAIANGHDTAWAINPGSSITDASAEHKRAELTRERAEFDGATLVKTGDLFIIEGVVQVCRVNGARFSDAIVFRPV